MAFFKFRLPGKSATPPEAAISNPALHIEGVRRRARHRLMGAVVLVFIAVVGFPLVFDTQPRPVSVDTPIVIPDQKSSAPLSAANPAPASAAPAAPLLAPAEAASALTAPSPAPSPVPAPNVSKAEPKEEILPDPPRPSKPEAKSSAKAEASPPDASKAEAPKAAASAPGSDRYVVQVGAYSDQAKLREVRRKLSQAGFNTYTQMAKDKEGKTTTRVRIGPFETQQDASKAGDKIRKLGLPVGILKL